MEEQQLDPITLTNIARAVKNGELDTIPSYLSLKDKEYVKEVLQLLYSADKAMKIWFVQKQYIEVAAEAAQTYKEFVRQNSVSSSLKYEYKSAQDRAYNLAAANDAMYNKLTRLMDNTVNAFAKQMNSRGATEQMRKTLDYAFARNVLEFTSTSEALSKQLMVYQPQATGARAALINQYLYRSGQLAAEFEKLGVTLPNYSSDSALKEIIGKSGFKSVEAEHEASDLEEKANTLNKKTHAMGMLYCLDVLGQVLQELGQNLYV